MVKSSSDTNELMNPPSRDDLDSFRKIYLNSYDRLRRYGKALGYNQDLVQDKIQDLFVWLMSHPEKLKGVKNIDTYLLKCLRQNIGTYLKREKKRGKNAEKYHQNQSTEANIESQMIDSENLNHQSIWITYQLDQLPPQQKEVIYLRFYEGLSYDEIAEIFSVSNQVVRNGVFRAIKRLRKNVSRGQN